MPVGEVRLMGTYYSQVLPSFFLFPFSTVQNGTIFSHRKTDSDKTDDKWMQCRRETETRGVSRDADRCQEGRHRLSQSA